MPGNLKILMAAVFILAVSFSAIAQDQTMNHELNPKQQSIVVISALTAVGDLENLKAALKDGLDAGLTVNEIKEALVHLYAYSGFPRSLNAIHAFMEVLEERRIKGIRDEAGQEAGPLPADWNRDEYGARVRASLAGQETVPAPGGYQLFAPVIDSFLKEHLFADIFARDILDFQTRELATISALAAMSGTAGQLRFHLGAAVNVGLTEAQLQQAITMINGRVGRPETKAGPSFTGEGIFPRGEINEAFARYFTGTSYLARLSTEGVAIANVTFAPGCRNFWHIHHKGGQILLVTGGRGWYQEWGKPARELHAGDVVNVPPEVKHWHGAAQDSWFAHLAVGIPAAGGSNQWLEPVSDQEYNLLQGDQ
jgi:alkylhydroperoxidase/carboxymuconolactone decarboxylase family protein YurZ/quercetin dioxygenase-like cupin family protein